jgi:hypothetical protein
MYGLFEVRAMNKLAVILPFWERPNVTKLCFERLEMQRVKFGFDVFVSGDDESIVPKSWKCIEVPNLPLGNKLNTLIACTKDYDGVIILGSDDFVSDSVFELYQTIDCTKEVFYGFNDCHVYNAWTKQLKYGINYKDTIGVARLWTKPTLEKMDYKLYQSERNKGLDTNSRVNMLANGIVEVSIPYNGYFIVDVKCEDNITSPEIIEICTIEDEPKRLNELHKGILKLKTNGNPIINNPILMEKVKKETVQVRVIQDCELGSVGFEKALPYLLAHDLVKQGFVEFVNEVVEVVKPKAKRTPKK